jgi:hypothetical protein
MDESGELFHDDDHTPMSDLNPPAATGCGIPGSSRAVRTSGFRHPDAAKRQARIWRDRQR